MRTGICCVLMVLASMNARAQGALVEPSPVQPTAVVPTSVQPTTVQPTTVEPTVVQPTTVRPSTVQPTAVQPTPVTPTEVHPTAISTLITLETDSERIDGVLLDETAAGYLVRTATETRLVRYEAVKRVTRGVVASSPPRLAPPVVPAAPASPPTPQPGVSASAPPSAAPDVPLAKATDAAASAAPKPIAQLGFGWVFNMDGRHARSLALPKMLEGGGTLLGSRPDTTNTVMITMAFSAAQFGETSVLMGFDALGDMTSTRLVYPNGDACVDSGLGSCFHFSNGAFYDTMTLMGTLWIKGAYALGPARVWAGLGAAGAYVTGRYEPAVWGGISYGETEAMAFSIPFGAGVDLGIPMGDKRKMILFTQMQLGSPVYGADTLLFDDSYRWQTDSVGHAVDPTRVVVGVAFEQ